MERNNFGLIEELAGVPYTKNFKVLYSERYSGLNNNDRVIYSELVFRSQLSSKRGWIDDKGIYIKFSQDNLAAETGTNKSTVKRSMKKLEEHGLVKNIKQGANLPNKIYVYSPIFDEVKVQNELPVNENSPVQNEPMENGEFNLNLWKAQNEPMESSNCNSGGFKMNPENKYKENIKNIYKEQKTNANANEVANAPKQKPKNRNEYISDNDWLYTSYMNLNMMDRIINKTDYGWLNKLAEDYDKNLILYFFSKQKPSKKFKSVGYINSVLKEWNGKSPAEIEYLADKFFEEKKIKEQNEKYSNYNVADVFPEEEPKQKIDYQKISRLKMINEKKEEIFDVLGMWEELDQTESVIETRAYDFNEDGEQDDDSLPASLRIVKEMHKLKFN